ncbi:serine phosphatase RsbU (regulator of sigma subunit) [Catenulispora sp. GP43]|uniref:PP2C family protein-serine/threonine phosphatase n=1 Tax=Catenulispora sp. GP43 TaxID=3156263 RepID=UPI00351635F2
MDDSVVAHPSLPGARDLGAQDEQLRVLVVEDDPGDALLTMELIADSGLAATSECVTSAAAAVEIVGRARVDCVVLDLHLPDLHGFSGLDELLPALATTAVVVMTGLDDRAGGLAAMRSGAQDYLVKGQVEPEWFGRAIRYAVQRKRTEQSALELLTARWRAQENERLERGLLPTPLLRGAPIRVSSKYLPHRAGALLGGDFFDVVETDDGLIHAVIGDVSGHGPDEAALGAALRVAWRTLVLTGSSGPALVQQLERIHKAERGSRSVFTTLVSLQWRPGEPAAQVVRAGHPGVITRLNGRVRLHEDEHGPPLGIVPDATWPIATVPVDPGGEVILYTDGLYENRDEDDEVWGQERMLDAADALADMADGRFVNALISATRDRSGRGDSDDVAVLHLRHLPAGPPRPRDGQDPASSDRPPQSPTPLPPPGASR